MRKPMEHALDETRLDGIFQCKSWLVAYHQQAAASPGPAPYHIGCRLRPHGLRAACRPPHGKMHGGSTAVDRRTLPDSRRPEAGAKLQLDRTARFGWMESAGESPGGAVGLGRKGTWTRGRRSPFQWDDTNSLSPDSYPTGRHGLIDDWLPITLFTARLGSSEDSLHHHGATLLR
jgi:hypothetical protein